MGRIAGRYHGHGDLSCWRCLHRLQGRWGQRGDGSCTPAAISHDDEGDSESVKNEGATKSIMIHDEDDIRPRKSERWAAEIKDQEHEDAMRVWHTAGYSAASAAIRPWVSESRDEY